CGSTALASLIRGVRLPKPDRDFSRLSANEMLGVLESGDQRQVGALFDQVGGSAVSPTGALPYHPTDGGTSDDA
ncbi:MAG: hypothetical protein H7Y11_03050, partial [Armatimonadetes bacterium]|nr:hypothetical protein [Anaerolineae bacterium]